MEESILCTIKKLLGGVAEVDEHFDSDLIILINSEFAALNQLGVGPEEGFSITGVSETWSDYYGQNKKLAFVREYLFLKIKMVFDPPASSGMIEAMNKRIAELEWRIMAVTDF